MDPFFERFENYFREKPASQASEPLSPGSTIQLRISTEGAEEVFCFVRTSEGFELRRGASEAHDLEFVLTAAAAEAVLAERSQDIGTIGAGIARLIFQSVADRSGLLKSAPSAAQAQVRLRSGVFTLFQKGYLGVLKTGGISVGMQAIQKILSKLK